ncbi:MAG TPA: hypothetical protein VI382_08840, partial [Candidatus Manganitrophaceae bacterium]|nr:hypothetical protein [Candidatus Manganitrophaceae bacterium]
VADLKARYVQGKVGDVEVKRKLAKALNEFLAPIRDRRAKVDRDEKAIDDLLTEGTRRARSVAQETMRQVRRAMKIDYPFQV